jgi:predicted dehydrogenase
MKVYRCTKSYDSLAELLRDPQIEAVFLATPAPDHVAHTLASLKAGKHVLCAVPAAMSLEECATLREAVRTSGLTYMMAETSYWQQATITARKFYQAGKFGTLYAAESLYHHAGLEALIGGVQTEPIVGTRGGVQSLRIVGIRQRRRFTRDMFYGKNTLFGPSHGKKGIP